MRVLKYRQKNRLSYKETANHFDIRQGSTIASGQRQYNEEGFEGLNRPVERSKSMIPDKKNHAWKVKRFWTRGIDLSKRRRWISESETRVWKKLRALVQERERNQWQEACNIELRQMFSYVSLKTLLRISNLPNVVFMNRYKNWR